ncbi:hypothetical protein JCM3770_004805 [Rhodotorula araucariae]
MSPPTSSNSKKGQHRTPSGSAPSKRASSTKPTSLAGKRAASAALADDDAGAPANKRAKRSTSGKKSLREDELGVGAELAEEDMLETQDDSGSIDDDDDQDQGEDEDDEGDEGDGGVTRCVCREDNEEMASGLMIQCDTCKCWQHGPCVGLWDEKECPNRYFCELCKPNLHGPGGLLRKVNRKSSAPARGRSPSAGLPSSSKHPAPSSSSHTHAPAHTHTHPQHGKPRESADAALVHAVLDHAAAAGAAPGAGGEPKKRSTMNSRDAAYDDAIALSILGPGSAAMRARLERSRGGDASGSESPAESDDDVVEEVVVGPGRGKKKSGGSAKGGKAKGGATGAKRGTKGKSAPPRGRRSHSNPEADSPAPLDAADVEPKLERAESESITAVAEHGEPTAVAGVGDSHEVDGQELEGEMGPPGKRRRLSAEPEAEEKEDGVVEDNHVATQSQDATVQEEPVAEPEARLPSPQPSPVQHHGGARAKHPNQYTYRPKNGQPAPSRAPKSPVKRSVAAASAAPETNGKGAGVAAGGGGAVTTTFGWGMPEHLKHLAYLLPTQSPQPLVISSAVDPSAPPVTEPSTKVRFPGKRVTMPEMRKRARTVLDFVTKVQLEMSERERRWDLLRDVNERVRDARERNRVRRDAAARSTKTGSGESEGAGAGSTTSGSRASSVVAHPRGVGGTTPVPPSTSTALPDLALGALPPLPGMRGGTGGIELSSAPSAESAALMDALAKEVVQFQQRFFGIVE